MVVQFCVLLRGRPYAQLRHIGTVQPCVTHKREEMIYVTYGSQEAGNVRIWAQHVGCSQMADSSMVRLWRGEVVIQLVVRDDSWAGGTDLRMT